MPNNPSIGSQKHGFAALEEARRRSLAEASRDSQQRGGLKDAGGKSSQAPKKPY